jgi:hypothetical protein
MPTKTRTMPTGVLTERQRDALVKLAELAPHYRAETVPTRRLNMGTARALERRNLVEFRMLPSGTGQGVRLTLAGAKTADDLVKLRAAEGRKS